MQFVSVGFSSAERIGGSRPHSFVLGYAAPEIVQFAEEHASEGKALEASTAMDTWSMGVIAIELLTGRPALDVDTDGVERVRFVSPSCNRRKQPVVVVGLSKMFRTISCHALQCTVFMKGSVTYHCHPCLCVSMVLLPSVRGY